MKNCKINYNLPCNKINKIIKALSDDFKNDIKKRCDFMMIEEKLY